MKQLSKRFYNRQEIANILELDATNKNFARSVKTKLMNWGYSFEYSRLGVTITRAPETAEEKLAEIIIRNYDINIQIDVKAFACFVAAFVEVESFEGMPWGEREAILKDWYNVTVTEKTLRSWCNKLIAANTIAKTEAKIQWRTQIINGVKTRELVDGNPEIIEEMLEYRAARKQLLQDYTIEFLTVNKFEFKKARSEAWKQANKTLWAEYGCCYYCCKGLALNAFDNLDVLQEVYELVKEVVTHNDSALKVDISIVPTGNNFDF